MGKSNPLVGGSPKNRKTYEGYFHTSVVIRNIEKDVSVRIVALTGRRNTKFCLISSLYKPEPGFMGESELLDQFPADAFKNRAKTGWTLRVAGTQRQTALTSDTIETALCSKAPLKPGSIWLDYEWADGQKG